MCPPTTPENASPRTSYEIKLDLGDPVNHFVRKACKKAQRAFALRYFPAHLDGSVPIFCTRRRLLCGRRSTSCARGAASNKSKAASNDVSGLGIVTEAVAGSFCRSQCVQLRQQGRDSAQLQCPTVRYFNSLWRIDDVSLLGCAWPHVRATPLNNVHHCQRFNWFCTGFSPTRTPSNHTRVKSGRPILDTSETPPTSPCRSQIVRSAETSFRMDGKTANPTVHRIFFNAALGYQLVSSQMQIWLWYSVARLFLNTIEL